MENMVTGIASAHQGRTGTFPYGMIQYDLHKTPSNGG